LVVGATPTQIAATHRKTRSAEATAPEASGAAERVVRVCL